MPKTLVPIAALVLILIAPFFSYRGTTTEKKHLWMTVFTHDLPAGSLIEGEHTYWFDFNWTAPKPGSQAGVPHQLTISTSAPLRKGYGLLRPSGSQGLVSGLNVVLCEPVEALHPAQPLRFMVAWVADFSLTRQEVQDHIKNMQATVRWDDQPAVQMVPRSISRSWEPVWSCDPWAVQRFPASGLELD